MTFDHVVTIIGTAALALAFYARGRHRERELVEREREYEDLWAQTEIEEPEMIEFSGSLAPFRDPGAAAEIAEEIDEPRELVSEDGEHLGVRFPDGTWIGGRN